MLQKKKKQKIISICIFLFLIISCFLYRFIELNFLNKTIEESTETKEEYIEVKQNGKLNLLFISDESITDENIIIENLKNKYNVTLQNKQFSSYTNGFDLSIINEEYIKNNDIFIINGGFYDFLSNSEMGSIGDNNKINFCSTINSLCKSLDDKKIIIINTAYFGEYEIDVDLKNPNGFYIKDYVDIQKILCSMNNVDLIDVYYNSINNPATYDHNNKKIIYNKEIFNFINNEINNILNKK